MAKVFISYTYDDHTYVEKLRKSLRRLKIAGEFDPVETSLQGAVFETMRERLKAVDAVIVLLSKRALASSGVMFELGAAQALGKKILPIVLPETDLDQLDFLDTDRAVLDARTLSLAETARRIEELVTEDPRV